MLVEVSPEQRTLVLRGMWTVATAPVIMTWHMGVELVHFAGKFSGALDPEKFWVAWDRGSDVTTDVFAPEWDFWAQVEEPLEELRAAYSVPMLDARYAAHGDVPDWYRPSAEAVRAACSGRYRRGDADAPARAGGHAPRPARS